MEEATTLPTAIWIPSHNMTIFRGSPVEMVCELASGDLEGPRPSVPEAIETVLRYIEQERGIEVTLPSNVSNERKSELALLVLMDLGIGYPAPSA